MEIIVIAACLTVCAIALIALLIVNKPDKRQPAPEFTPITPEAVQRALRAEADFGMSYDKFEEPIQTYNEMRAHAMLSAAYYGGK